MVAVTATSETLQYQRTGSLTMAELPLLSALSQLRSSLSAGPVAGSSLITSASPASNAIIDANLLADLSSFDAEFGAEEERELSSLLNELDDRLFDEQLQQQQPPPSRQANFNETSESKATSSLPEPQPQTQANRTVNSYQSTIRFAAKPNLNKENVSSRMASAIDMISKFSPAPTSAKSREGQLSAPSSSFNTISSKPSSTTKHSKPAPAPKLTPREPSHSFKTTPFAATPLLSPAGISSSLTDDRSAVLSALEGALDEKGENLIARLPTKRRFPGPAGALPPLSDEERQRVLRSSEASKKLSLLDRSKDAQSPAQKKARRHQQIDREPPDSRLFTSGAWMTMLRALSLPPFSKDPSSRSTIDEYNIALILRQTNAVKVPKLIVYIKEIRSMQGDVSVKFADQTGEIPGTLHKLVMDEFNKQITTGCVLVLQKVSVFHPSPRTHYLTVTRDNILRVFLAEPDAVEIREPEDNNASDGEPDIMVIDPPLRQSRNDSASSTSTILPVLQTSHTELSQEDLLALAADFDNDSSSSSSTTLLGTKSNDANGSTSHQNVVNRTESNTVPIPQAIDDNNNDDDEDLSLLLQGIDDSCFNDLNV